VKSRILASVFCVLAATGSAAWRWQNPLPSANDMTAIWFVNDTTGFAAGSEGLILRTDDRGEHWTAIGTTSTLADIQFPVGDQVGYGAGWGVRKTTDGGATWELAAFYEYTQSVCFPRGNDTGYIVYGSGQASVLKTTDGFATWTLLAHLISETGTDVAFVDTRRGWVVGRGGGLYGGFIFRTTDGGATWARQDSGHALGRRWSVSFLPDGLTGYTCGYAPSLQKTTDGGEHWDTLPAPTFDEALCVSFPSGPDTGFVIGELSNRHLTYRTTDGGSTWDSLPGTDWATAIHFPRDSRTGYLAGHAGTLERTTDAGETWAALTHWTPGTSLTSFLSGVDFPIDERTGFVVGNRGVFLKTTDGGGEWHAAGSFDTLCDLKAVCSAGVETLFIAGMGSYLNGRVWRSTDAGASWDTVLVAASSMPSDIQFPGGPDTGFLVDRSLRGVRRTTNAGDSWTFHSLGTYVNALDFPTSLAGYVVGDNGTVFKTTDGGENWANVSTILRSDWYDVAFPAGPDTGFVCGSNGYVCKTTDGGGSWQIQNSVTQDWLYSLSFPNDAQTGYAAGQSVVMKTTDGGANWYSQSANCNQTLMAMQFPLNSATGYAVGSAGTIIKTGTGGEGIEEREKSEVRRVKGGATVVRGVLFLPEARGARRETRGELLDVSGRKVLGLRPGANDVSRLSPGVYFVQAGLPVLRRQVVVVK
jgi:photosystem II stability/assembly factor-like uncharacterized protein